MNAKIEYSYYSRFFLNDENEKLFHNLILFEKINFFEIMKN